MITQKKCLKCEKEQDVINFAKQSSNADGTGYKSYCRKCYKGMRRKYYVKNHKAALKRSKKTTLRLNREFQAVKSKFKCNQCGEKDPRCLDFHHKDPKLKLKSVRDCFFQNGKEAAQKEMDKCEVLCANCHRKHHHKLTITVQDISDLYPSIGEGI